MEESSQLAKAVCQACGIEFEYEKKCAGRGRKFCSKKCAEKHFNKKYSNKSRQARFDRDPEYKEMYYKRNADRNKQRIAERKEQMMLQIIDELWGAKDDNEMRAILEKYTRIKSEFYRG